jgi:hypothetical protein
MPVPYNIGERCLYACGVSEGETMADEVYCDICREQNELTPATIAFRVQREDDPDATPQYVRSCDQHEGQAAVAAALIRSNISPATVHRSVLRGTVE